MGDDKKSDEDLKDEDEHSKSKTVVETPLPESEESKERDLGSTGRISCCHRNRGDNWEDEFDPRDVEISLLKVRLEETEKAMERIVAQMGVVTSRLAPHVIAQALEGMDFGQEASNKKIKQEDNVMKNDMSKK